MKRGPIVAIAAACLVALLPACSEKEQTIGNNRSDGTAFQGPPSAFTATGWKPGDKTSWEAQLRSRTQNGQNDYNKVN